jgi:hypothetical protein
MAMSIHMNLLSGKEMVSPVMDVIAQ